MRKQPICSFVAFLTILFSTDKARAQWDEVFYNSNVEWWDIHMTSPDSGYALGYDNVNALSFVAKTYNGFLTIDTVRTGVGFKLRDFQFINDTFVVACGHNGTVMHSYDACNTWSYFTDVNPGVTTDHLITLGFAQPCCGVAVTSGGNHYYSMDTGKTWVNGFTIILPGSIPNATSTSSKVYIVQADWLLESTDSSLAIWMPGNVFGTIIGFYSYEVQIGYSNRIFLAGKYNVNGQIIGVSLQLLPNSWMHVSTDYFVYLSTLYSMALPHDSAYYAMGDANNNDKDYCIYKSIDKGQHWFTQNVNLVMSAQVYATKVRCVDRENCFAFGGPQILNTREGGGPLIHPADTLTVNGPGGGPSFDTTGVDLYKQNYTESEIVYREIYDMQGKKVYEGAGQVQSGILRPAIYLQINTLRHGDKRHRKIFIE